MAQQGSELVNVLADEFNHRDINGDHTPVVYESRESVRIVSFDNKQFGLYAGTASDAKVRQQQPLNRLPSHG
jgi:hypothetical protein